VSDSDRAGLCGDIDAQFFNGAELSSSGCCRGDQAHGASRICTDRRLACCPYLSAHYGIRAVAFSTFVTVPFNVGLSVLVVRAHITFSSRESSRAIIKSAVVAGLSAVGPLIVIAFRETGGPSTLAIAIATSLGGVGWLAGLWLTHHPLFGEVREVVEVIARSIVARIAGVGRPVGGPR
jgi:hypothetical protein